MKEPFQPNLRDDPKAAAAMAALGHPARLAIMRHLSCCDACCCKDVVARLDLAQSTVSQHLKVLVDAGLVSYEPQRPRSRYALNHQVIADVQQLMNDLFSSCCRQADAGAEQRRKTINP